MTSFIFDMDGTLFQTDKILEISLQDTFDILRSLGQWNGVTPIEKYRQIMGVPLPVVWETLMPNHSIDIHKQANATFHDHLIANIHKGMGSLYPNVKEVFQFLKDKNCSIFIASNGQTEYLKSIVDHFGLNQWVTETFSIQQISTQNKSDLVRFILNKYKITSGTVVGDRLSDIMAAKRNNLVSIGCNFDFAQEDELSQAHIVVDDLLELKTISQEQIKTYTVHG